MLHDFVSWKNKHWSTKILPAGSSQSPSWRSVGYLLSSALRQTIGLLRCHVGRLSSVGCSPGSVTTPAHLSQLPQDQKLSLAGLQLFLCSWKTGDRVSWPWLLHTLRTGVIKAPPSMPLMSTQDPGVGNNTPVQPCSFTLVSLSAPHPTHTVYHAGKRSSWQTCSLSVSIFHSLWRPGNLPALSYLSHISVIIFVRKRQIASDGWGELWRSRTGWVRAKECGRVWSGMDGEVCLLCSTLILFREMHRKEGP